MGGVWDFDKAMEMLPHLAVCAKERRTITYGELGAKIDVIPLYMTKPLDTLRDRILIKHGLPRIDALVVNKETREVGDSFYPEGFGTLTLEDRRALLDSEREQVYNYENWEKVILNLKRHYGAEQG